MSEKDKATSIAKLISAAARKKKRQPIKVVKAAGANRGIAGRPRGGMFRRCFWGLWMLTRVCYSQGAIQDGGPKDEEGDAGYEEDIQEEEVMDVQMGRSYGTLFKHSASFRKSNGHI